MTHIVKFKADGKPDEIIAMANPPTDEEIRSIMHHNSIKDSPQRETVYVDKVAVVSNDELFYVVNPRKKLYRLVLACVLAPMLALMLIFLPLYVALVICTGVVITAFAMLHRVLSVADDRTSQRYEWIYQGLKSPERGINLVQVNPVLRWAVETYELNRPDHAKNVSHKLEELSYEQPTGSLTFLWRKATPTSKKATTDQKEVRNTTTKPTEIRKWFESLGEHATEICRNIIDDDIIQEAYELHADLNKWKAEEPQRSLRVPSGVDIAEKSVRSKITSKVCSRMEYHLTYFDMPDQVSHAARFEGIKTRVELL